MDLSDLISSVYTAAVGADSGWALCPGGFGGVGGSGVTAESQWLPITMKTGGVEGEILLTRSLLSEDVQSGTMFCLVEQVKYMFAPHV